MSEFPLSQKNTTTRWDFALGNTKTQSQIAFLSWIMKPSLMDS